MSKELKPCPFCGGEAKYDYGDLAGRVTCQDCKADIYRDEWAGSMKHPSAVDAWNARTSDAVSQCASFDGYQAAQADALATKESMQKRIDYHNERADKAEKLLKDLRSSYCYIEQHLRPCVSAEIGVHRTGDVNPYFVSWNDGEFRISTSWAQAKSGIGHIDAFLEKEEALTKAQAFMGEK